MVIAHMTSFKLHLRKTTFSEYIVFGIFGVSLISIAGMSLLGFSADYSNYFDWVVDKTGMQLSTKEISFILIVWINDVLFGSNIQSFFFMFAMIGVSIKLFVFWKYSKIPVLSLFLYTFSYFLLHEYVQIRAGVATGIFLLAIKDLAIGDFKKYFEKAILAILFHWSSVILLPLYFVIRFTKQRVFFVLPLIGVILYQIGISFNETVQTMVKPVRMLSYYFQQHSGHTEKINAYNLISVSELGIFYFIVYLFTKRKNLTQNIDLTMLNIFSTSLFLFYVFSAFELPVIAFRLSEYLNVVLLLLIPVAVSQFKQKKLLSLIFVFYFIFYSYHLIVKTQAIPSVLTFFQSIV